MSTEQLLQVLGLAATAALFVMAFLLGFAHLKRLARGAALATSAHLPHEASIGTPARLATAAGILLGAALFAWRASAAHTLTLAVSDPFDAFLVLGLLLAFVVVYFRWTRHLRSLSFFLLPMVAVLLLLGLVLALIHPDIDRQNYRHAWTLVHIVTIFGGTICFVLGCVGGVVYLLADRQLKRRGTATQRWFGYPPLASIEKFNQWMINVGFPLLAISTVAGILRIAQAHHAAVTEPATAYSGPSLKIVLGILALGVYAVLLNVPLQPRLRGRRAAWLSIIGLVLFLGAFVAARWGG